MPKEITQEYMEAFEKSEKIGLIATITPEGLPHITFINSIQANTPTQMMFGHFIEGTSKENVKQNPKVGFLIMSLQREFWTGKASWTHLSHEGPEYVLYNDKPLYRYNTYTGVHTVHFMDLEDLSEKTKLNTAAVAKGGILSLLSKGKAGIKRDERILNQWSEDFFNKIDNLKFISFIDREGYPVILPVIQAQAADSGRIVFPLSPYAKALKSMPEGTKVAILGVSLGMENVLVEAEFKGFKRCRGVNLFVADIDRVYNPMPPKAGYIYPEEKPQRVTSF